MPQGVRPFLRWVHGCMGAWESFLWPVFCRRVTLLVPPNDGPDGRGHGGWSMK